MSKSFASLVAVLALAGCATASAPDSTPTDGSVGDSSVADTGTSEVGDAPTDVPCLAPSKVCGGKCVNTSADPKNCGDCGKACGETSACISGTCQATGCTKDQVACPDGTCANLLSDHDHCGDCTTKCKDIEKCTDAVCKLDCSTKPGTVDCGTGICADLKTDKNNCGTCLHSCTADQTCTAGTCNCPAGDILCSDPLGGGTKCTDTSTDANNCGTCGTICYAFEGKTCVKGTCVCAAPKADCGTGTCTDLSSDNANCGKCGTACDTAHSMACHGGSCVLDCGTTGTDCSGVCKFLGSDPANCGTCGHACAAGQFCSGGACTCFSGLTNCSGVCEDLRSDGSNCGFCGRACTTGTVCSGGSCSASCGGGRTPCGTSCLDTTSDKNNCGSCGHVCSGSTPFCSGGTCISAPPCKTSGPYSVLFAQSLQGSGTTGGTDETPYLPSGSVVTSADDATWRGMTTSDFAKFDLIVIGEGGVCPASTRYQAVTDTAAVWSAAVVGRVVVTEQDPVFHASVGKAGADVFLRAVLQWTAGGPGTGLYVGADCGATKLAFLSQFGAFDSLSGGGDAVHIVDPSHPIMIGSTDATLSTWSSSYHGNIDAFPPDFELVAQVSGGTGNITVARDKTCAP